MPVALDPLLAPRLMGSARLLALADTALQEACLPFKALPRRFGSPLPVYLVLPEVRPGFAKEDAEAVERRAHAAQRTARNAREVTASPRGMLPPSLPCLWPRAVYIKESTTRA